jgi:ketosteroid isomerase-like protein
MKSINHRAKRRFVGLLPMSVDPNVVFLRGVYEKWALGDFSSADMFDPEVEFVQGGIEPQTYRGPEGVTEGWFAWLSAWKDFRVEAREIIPGTEPNSYVIFCHLTGRGKESGVPTESETANVIWLRDGKIRRMELHWDREAAREAAGLTPR